MPSFCHFRKLCYQGQPNVPVKKPLFDLRHTSDKSCLKVSLLRMRNQAANRVTVPSVWRPSEIAVKKRMNYYCWHSEVNFLTKQATYSWIAQQKSTELSIITTWVHIRVMVSSRKYELLTGSRQKQVSICGGALILTSLQCSTLSHNR